MDLARKAKEILLSKKGQNVTLLDVTGLSDVADYFLIVTATSSPHVRAMADELEHVLKKQGVPRYRHAGTPESEWVVVDYLDVVIHIFTSKTRGYYAIEKLWGDAPRLE